MTPPQPSAAWPAAAETLVLTDAHAHEPRDVASALGVDPAAGLDPAEAARRAERAGPNALEAAKREGLPAMLLDAATEPFVVLLAVAGLAAVLLGEVRDGLLVLAGLVPIVGADAITEYRGERALEALRDATAPTARTRRDGKADEVPAAALVPGDVVLLRTGDIVPADLRIVRAERLQLDRSLLTGESLPESGAEEADPIDAQLADRRSMAYSGTAVVGGRGEGIVVAIGAATEMGRIAGGLAGQERRRSPVQRELDRLVRILLVVAVALITITMGLGFLRGQDAGANVLAGISAAIAAIPEEPPVLLAVILGLGAYRLLRRGVLVRRLNAQETLGAIDLIVTDKTGTLTENRLDVASVRVSDGPVAVGDRRSAILVEALRAEDDAWRMVEGVAPSSFTRSLARAVEAADASGRAAPEVAGLDPAILVAAAGVTDDRPWSSTKARMGDGEVELALGAPEAVLALAGHGATGHGADAATAAWHDQLESGAADGERLVGLARREGPNGWEMRALIGFADPLRPGIREAMATARDAGIQTVMVTGDHPRTAAAIARDAGLDADRVVAGEELAGWSDDRLAAELASLHVVARSVPEGKERLVRLARAGSRMVAVTGDGVNDAPALHAADVAVSMGSGTAVAKEASDLVLGDDSFATLMYGLAEGRRIVDNIQKGLVFLVSTHVAMLGFVLIATLYGYGQPLLPLQILWLELFIDTSTSVAFEREPAEPDLMRRRPRRAGVPLLSNAILVRIALAGGFSAFAALWLMAGHGGSLDHARWLAYTALVIGQVVRAYANRSLRSPLQRLPRNGFLLLATAAVAVVQVAIPYVPALAEAFHASPLDATDWLLVVVVALGPALLAQLVRTVRPGTLWVA